MNNIETNKHQIQVSFLAIDKWNDDSIVRPTEKEVKGKDFISWGDNNNYPDYLESLYIGVSTLKSIIDGLTDYICGDKILFDNSDLYVVNRKGHTIQDIIKWIAKDYCKFGGFALNIIRNKFGKIAEIYYLDFKKVRSNDDNSILYYSKDWAKSFGRVKYIELPNFFSEDEEGKSPDNSIFYYKNDINYVYPVPMYAGSILSCEIAKKINTYHYNNINNNFAGNYIVNFNSGKPTDEQKEEIENDFYDKFTGVENAGRPLLSFNNSKINETTITKIDSDNFADKYNALSQSTRQEIFTAFRATPNLFGIPTETTGFSQQEYFEAYELFYRTVVKPIQDKIISCFNKIYDGDFLEIEPFNVQIND